MRGVQGIPGDFTMLNRLGRGLIFVAGSVVGGLALAFLIVALRPDLIREAPGAAPATPVPAPVAGCRAPRHRRMSAMPARYSVPRRR